MADHPLGDWLSYRDQLPLAWRPLSAEGVPAAWAEQNLRTLAAVATLEERSRSEPDAVHALELERLNHKFDVMIELLGALLRNAQPLPLPSPVRLSREGLSWVSAPMLAPGSQQVVELYLHPCAPMPWRWTGEIVAQKDGETFLRFAPMSELLAAALERHVFMRHRRSVADARSPASRGQPETPP